MGIDRSLGMLKLAESKGLSVSQGDVLRLPLGNGSLDAAICSLAIAHFEELVPPLSELARVVRPGGSVLISDLHPVTIASGAHASFEDASGKRGVMRNHLHLHSDYLNAFAAVGLDMVACLEATWSDNELRLLDIEPFPGLIRSAIGGLPIVLAWHLRVT